MKSLRKFRELMANKVMPLRPEPTNSRFTAGFESLEDRILLTTFFVDSLDDSIGVDGQTTLREAIVAANTNAPVGDAAAGESSGDKIRFDSSLQDSTIALTNGELAITDDLVIDARDVNIAIDAGGTSRVFIINANDDVVVKGLTLRNGSATEGGAIYAANGQTTLANLTIMDSEAISLTTGGGAIFNDSGSKLLVIDSDLNRNSSIAATGGGGAIFNDGGIVNVHNSFLRKNTASGASGSGGAVLSTDGIVRLVDTVLRSNGSVRAGGGLELVDGVAVLANASLLTNSTGSMVANPGNGGAVHVSGNASRVIVNGGRISGNTAALEGGGLWNQSGSAMVIRDASITSNIASGAAADQGGGGVFNNGGNLIISSTMLNSNVADGTSGSGGGILSTDGFVSLTDSTLSGNRANRAGGGIEIIDGTMKIDGTVLGGAATKDGNVAGPSGSANPGNGGGLHVSGSSGTRVVVIGGSVIGNVAASEGGGLWNQSGSTMVVRSGTALSDNLAFGDDSDTGGGAIFNNGGDLFVSDASIVGNFALGTSGSGGGIFTSDGNVLVSDSLIDSNTASRAGGGAEVVDGNVRFHNVNINANTAGTNATSTPGNGGGVHVTGTNAKLTFVDGFVQNNTAAKEGGGLWNQSGSAMRLKGTVVSGNNSLSTDPAAGGGGIFNNGGRLEVRNANVSGNDSASSGGGIFGTDGGTMIVKDSIVNGNDSDDIGGGILNAGDLVVAGTDIIGNVAANNGGGILTAATGQTKVFDSIITGNSPNDRFDA